MTGCRMVLQIVFRHKSVGSKYVGHWGAVNAMIILVSAVSMSSAIEVANSSLDYPQKLALTTLLSSHISQAWSVGGLFLGLWLIPMGYIVVSTRCMPLWLGRVLLAGGVGYIIQTLVVAAGVKSAMVDVLVIPASIGEFWMVGYLLIFGIRPVGNEEGL